MKKKLFGIMLVLAVILFAGYTVYNSHGDIKLSDVTLANLEAQLFAPCEKHNLPPK